MNLPSGIEIFESNSHIVFRDIKWKSGPINQLSCHYCKNITIENCEIDTTGFYYCSHIDIRNFFGNNLDFVECEKCSLDNIEIEWLYLAKLDESTIKNSEILWRFTNFGNKSRGNVLENNKFSFRDVELDSKLKDIDKLPVLKDDEFTIYNDFFECRGAGTKTDPIIIENVNAKSKVKSKYGYKHHFNDILVYKNRFNVIMKNYHPKKVKLFDTQNMIFENCSFTNSFSLDNCSNIMLRDVKIKKLEFGACHDIIIENSSIDKIIAREKVEGIITLKNCSVNRIKKSALKKIVDEN